MPMHMVGYETSASQASPLAITPIPDGTVRVTGNDILVPAGMNNIVSAMAEINSAAATLRAQLTSPSLRATINIDVSPINNGLVSGTFPRCLRNWYAPFPLVVNEPLDFLIQNGGAVMNRGFVIFADAAVKPTTGNIYTIRATASATLATATWVNGTLTFSQTLPAGTYSVVGVRSWGANQVAARIFFVGSPWRPGVYSVNAEDNNEDFYFRYGNIGVWGNFVNTVPPTVDFMGITDTAQVVYFDLIKTG